MFRSNTLTDAQCQNKQIDDTSFWRDLVRFGDTTAVVRENGERISYGELAARADDFAQRLGKERRLVAIEAHNSLETLCGYLGALRGGHPVVLLPPGADERNLGIYANFAPDARYRLTDEGWELTLSEPAGGLHNDLALALSTSGTTGSSKLVRLSGRALSSNANAIVRYLGIDVTDRAITSLPLYYSYVSGVPAPPCLARALWLKCGDGREPPYDRIGHPHWSASEVRWARRGPWPTGRPAPRLDA